MGWLNILGGLSRNLGVPPVGLVQPYCSYDILVTPCQLGTAGLEIKKKTLVAFWRLEPEIWSPIPNFHSSNYVISPRIPRDWKLKWMCRQNLLFLICHGHATCFHLLAIHREQSHTIICWNYGSVFIFVARTDLADSIKRFSKSSWNRKSKGQRGKRPDR